MSKNITGVIFDVDGVLLDSLWIWKDLGIRYLNDHNIKPAPGLSEILFSMSLEEGAFYLKHHYPISETEDRIIEDLQKSIEDFYYSEVTLKKDIKDILEIFQQNKIPMVIATSSAGNHVETALKRNGILSYFSGIFTTGEIGKSKHFADIFMAAAESINSMPKNTLVFEDSLYALQTAKRAGFPVIGVFDAEGESESNQKILRQESEIYMISYKEAVNELRSLLK